MEHSARRRVAAVIRKTIEREMLGSVLGSRTTSVAVATLLLTGASGAALAQSGAEAGRTGLEQGPVFTDTAGIAISDAADDPSSAARALRAVSPSLFSAPAPVGLAAQQEVDPWGAKKSLGLAVGEVIAVNIVVWGYNEYIRGANFTQVSPRTWWDNIKTGWFYDDNHFNNNQFAHPYHGSLYYNAGRSTGHSYWESALFALAGSFNWECCGETHRMAINDWIATGIGGTAIGEMTYRIGSTFLDNTSTGSSRIWKEVGNFVLNPVRGVNRLGSGRWSRTLPNPQSPYDRIAPFLTNHLLAGVRVIGEGESITDSTEIHGFIEFDFRFGSVFDDGRRKPFDWFNVSVQGNFGDEEFLGRLQIKGNMFSKDLKKSEKTQHVFAVAQDYDYINNNLFQFGGQSVSPGIWSRWTVSDKFRLVTRLEAFLMLMGAVNSEFAFLAELPDVSRLREYDYGPGVGGGASITAQIAGKPVATLFYRMQWISVVNGSSDSGGDANHYVHFGGIRANVPIYKGFGLGADAFVFLRNSFFDAPELEDTSQRVPQVRLYGTWWLSRIGG